MDTPQEKYTVPSQVTIRFTKEQQEFVNENIHHLIGDDINITRNQLFVKALTEAVSKSTPKVTYKDSEETLTQIQTLTAENETLSGKLDVALSDLEAAKTNMSNSELPKGSIILQLPPKDHKYFWGCLQVCKKIEFAKTYEAMLMKMFEAFQARGEFIFTQADIEYLNTLDYEGPAEEPANPSEKLKIVEDDGSAED